MRLFFSVFMILLTMPVWVPVFLFFLLVYAPVRSGWGIAGTFYDWLNDV